MDSISEVVLSQWVTLVEKKIIFPNEPVSQSYYSLKQSDYVSIFAITSNRQIPLVRQYRPALDRFTIELPGGLREFVDSPENTAARELYEETGYRVNGQPNFLGVLDPDTGRLENKLWGYFALTPALPCENWAPESGLEKIMVSPIELRDLIIGGEFNHALHLALIGLAIIKGYFKWDS